MIMFFTKGYILKFVLSIIFLYSLLSCSESSDKKNQPVITQNNITNLDQAVQAKAIFDNEALSGYTEISEQNYINLYEQTNTLTRGLTIISNRQSEDIESGDNMHSKYISSGVTKSVVIKADENYVYELVSIVNQDEGKEYVVEPQLYKFKRSQYITRKLSSSVRMHPMGRKYMKNGNNIQIIVFKTWTPGPGDKYVQSNSVDLYRIEISANKIANSVLKNNVFNTGNSNYFEYGTSVTNDLYTTQGNLESYRSLLQNTRIYDMVNLPDDVSSYQSSLPGDYSYLLN